MACMGRTFLTESNSQEVALEGASLQSKVSSKRPFVQQTDSLYRWNQLAQDFLTHDDHRLIGDDLHRLQPWMSRFITVATN